MSEERLPDVTCSGCGAPGRVVRLTEPDEVTVRGMTFAVTMVYRRCEACGGEFENSRDPDWREDAYAQYRDATGMVQPARLLAWREARGLTVAEAAARAGWPEITWQRYELGALQSDAHDCVLKDLLAGAPG